MRDDRHHAAGAERERLVLDWPFDEALAQSLDENRQQGLRKGAQELASTLILHHP